MSVEMYESESEAGDVTCEEEGRTGSGENGTRRARMRLAPKRLIMGGMFLLFCFPICSENDVDVCDQEPKP